MNKVNENWFLNNNFNKECKDTLDRRDGWVTVWGPLIETANHYDYEDSSKKSYVLVNIVGGKIMFFPSWWWHQENCIEL